MQPSEKASFTPTNVTHEMIPPASQNTDLPTSSTATESDISTKEEVSAVVPAHVPQKIRRLNFLDRFLALWIILAMAVGIILGYFVPNTSVVLEKAQFVDVSVPLAVALILMMWPILCRVSPSALYRLFTGRQIWYHLGFSLAVNWIIAPLVMLGLSWAFLPDKKELREGLILVGIARCIAMVLVWTDIAKGDMDYCAVLVAFNSILQIVLFAPFGILYIGVIGGGNVSTLSYSVVARSVAAFLGIPLAAALVTRGGFILFKAQHFFQTKFLPTIAPLSLIALLFTTLIIFAAQGRQVVDSIVDVIRVMAPLIVYFVVMFFSVLFLCKKVGVGYGRTTSQAFTGASNNFELAIAVAVAVYGANSPQALAATVGPLVEVPVLLGLAYALVWYRERSGWDIDQDSKAAKKSSGPKDLERAQVLM